MTDSEIDALPAGPEMDRAVARALGRTDCLFVAGQSPGWYICQDCGEDKWNHVPIPRYSTDPGVALAALERWVSANWQRCYEIKRLEREGPDDDPLYSAFVSFSGGRLWYQSFDDMIAVAICRALLKAEKGRNKSDG